jgi:hypothetical protein
MATFESLFPKGADVGPVTIEQLDEYEREKKRKERQLLAEKNRKKKIQEKVKKSQQKQLPTKLPQKTITDQNVGNFDVQLPSSSNNSLTNNFGISPSTFNESDLAPSTNYVQPNAAPQRPIDELKNRNISNYFNFDFSPGRPEARSNYVEDSMPQGEIPSSYSGMGIDQPVGLNLSELNEYSEDVSQLPGANRGYSSKSLSKSPKSSREMLYEYLQNRRSGEPQFQKDYKDATQNAERNRMLNTYLSGLGEVASMAGTVGGKRADTGNLKALPESIYQSQMQEAKNLMGLREISNQEQIGDIKMLRDLEKGDLDNIRIQKILADMQRQRTQPKNLPYFVPGDEGTLPKAVMMGPEGEITYKDLPAGTRSTMERFQFGEPVYEPSGQPVFPVRSSFTGRSEYVPSPPGTKTLPQLKIQSDAELQQARNRVAEIDQQMRLANSEEKKRLEREKFDLQKAKLDYQKNIDAQRLGQKAKTDAERLGVQKTRAERAPAKPGGGVITEGERKTGLQAQTALNALNELESMEVGDPASGIKPYRPSEKFTSIAGELLGGHESVLGNQLIDDPDRAYNVASSQMIEMLLRAVTGAAAQKDEIRRMFGSYKIMRGDDPNTIKFKQKSRREFVENLLKAGGRSTQDITMPPTRINQQQQKTIQKKQYSPSRNQTRIIYSDGSTEILEGKQ